MVRAHWIDVGGSVHRLRRRRDASPIRGSKACSSTSSRSIEAGELDDTLFTA